MELSPDQFGERHQAVMQAVGIKGFGKEHGVDPRHADTLRGAVHAIASSSVPLEHLEGLRVGVQPRGKNTRLEAARYKNGTAYITEGADPSAIVHEIGHHVDRSSPRNSAAEHGRSEGFADAYSEAHGVPRPANPQQWSARTQYQGRQQEFNEAYHQARQSRGDFF